MTDQQTKSQVGAQITTTHTHNPADDIFVIPFTPFATANRPINVKQYTAIFDTTLGKPVYAKVGGAVPVWVDGTGATV
jgi:hypothetical protein